MLSLWAAKRNCISRVPESVAVQSHAPEIGGVGDGGVGGGGVMGLVFGLVWFGLRHVSLSCFFSLKLAAVHGRTTTPFRNSAILCFLDPSWILLLSPPAPASLSQIVSPLDDVVVGVLLQSFFSMQSLSESRL
jgi:hypothetical protein